MFCSLYSLGRTSPRGAAMATTPPTSDAFHTTLMKALGAAIPDTGKDDWAGKWDNAREQFAAFNPQNAAEAQLAAFAIAAMEGAMDNLQRATQPDLSAEKAGRLRGSALAAGRFYFSVYRTLRKSAATKPERPASSAPPAQPAKDEPCPPGYIRLAPGAEPIKHYETFQPRNRHGKPIPQHRFQDMTPAQRRATYTFPRDPELEAIAVAEEEAMIAAEQAANSTASGSG